MYNSIANRTRHISATSSNVINQLPIQLALYANKIKYSNCLWNM